MYERGWCGIFGMVTLAPHRRRGVASTILHALARDADDLYLQVEQDNAAARALREGRLHQRVRLRVPGQTLTISFGPSGSTRIFTCASGWPSASNAAGTASIPHVPVIIGVTSISPSAIARKVSAKSNGS